MTAVTKYVDVEDLAKAWVLSTDVAALINNKAFLAMPKGSPLPSITLSRVGGGIVPGSDVPIDVARISFSIWGTSRPQVKEIAKLLVSEADSIALTGGFNMLDPIDDVVIGRIEVGEIATWFWSPDPVSDTPRYIVDIRFTVTPVDVV